MRGCSTAIFFLLAILLNCAIPAQARTLRVLDTMATTSNTVTVTVVMDGDGCENAAGFSLAYNPALLTYVNGSTVLTPEAPMGTVLLVNPQLDRIGFICAVPPGGHFPARKGTLLIFTFRTAATPAITGLFFATMPVACEIVDAEARPLPAILIGGTVAISR